MEKEECACKMHDRWPVYWVDHKCFCDVCKKLIFESSAKKEE